VSREVVRDAALESEVAEDRLLATLEEPPHLCLLATLEEPPHLWEKTPGKIPSCLNLVRTALLRRAHGMDLVYHGYAGHLPDGLPGVLRARVIADDASRIAAAMRDKHLEERQAAEFACRARRGAGQVDEVPVRRLLA
jgi:hypothetical protein